MQAQDQFTGKAGTYEKNRPGYPDTVYDFLFHWAPSDADIHVADIAAGTGLFTRGLLTRAARVYAVEPNADMRACLATLSPAPMIIDALAEETGLADNCVDLITVAQAFHWFDPVRFRDECRRIGKEGVRVAVIWNRRIPCDMENEYAALCRRICPGFHGFAGGDRDFDIVFSAFFAQGVYETHRFPNPQQTDRARYIGRALSSSYAPRPDDPHYHTFIEETGMLFDRYAPDGTACIPHETVCCIGTV